MTSLTVLHLAAISDTVTAAEEELRLKFLYFLMVSTKISLSQAVQHRLNVTIVGFKHS